MRWTFAMLLGLLTLSACASGEGTGDLGYNCYPNGTCNDGLVCVMQVCRDPNAPVDAGPPDAGAVPRDAGAQMDAGQRADAGAPGDAGPGQGDAGRSDAGPPMGDPLPLDHPLPMTASGTVATRLGQRALVIAYMNDVDTSTPEPEELVLQRIRRSHHNVVIEAPQAFTQAAVSPGSDNQLKLAGALGDDHVFFIVMIPGGTHVLRLFRDDGTAFVDLGTTTLGAPDFASPPAFFNGHPVDSTRYVVGYRESNSGRPYTYRLLIRTGDSLRFGPPTQRPPSTAFPGLSTAESQTDPALFRVGPTTFVEARPGYVQPPGSLSTWTLTVNADETLNASNPRVQSTVGLTMSPEVAADGEGGAVIVYNTYRVMDYRYGLYDHSTGVLSQRASPLATSQESIIRTHHGESTDRFLGGAYYLRLRGGNMSPAPLFRIDATTGTSAQIDTVPDLWRCYRAPQMVRIGTIAAYVGCYEARLIDLLPLCGNGAMDPGETCDDGNNVGGDGCSAGCLTR